MSDFLNILMSESFFEEARKFLLDAHFLELISNRLTNLWQSLSCLWGKFLGFVKATVEKFFCIFGRFFLFKWNVINFSSQLLFVVFGSSWIILVLNKFLLEPIVLLKEVPQPLVASSLNNLDLICVPSVAKDSLDVVLVRTDVSDVDFCAIATDEGAKGNVCMSWFTFVAVDAELVVGVSLKHIGE